MKVIIKDNSSIVLLLIISAFGFYLPIGVRIDQLLVNMVFLYVVISVIILKKKLVIVKPILRFLAFFLVFYFMSFSLWIINSSAKLNIYTLGQLERFFSPFAVVVIVSFFCSRYNMRQLQILLIKSSKVMIFFSFIASLVVIHNFYTGNHYISDYFQPVLSDLEQRTSFRSLKMGRYSGIFSSPFESGIVYSLSLFCYTYLDKINRQNNVYMFMIIFVIIGAFLAVSKAWIIGFVMFVYLYFGARLKKNMLSLIPVLAVGISLIIIVGNYLSKEWTGYDRLVSLVEVSGSNENLLYKYSGGRLSGNGTGTLQNRAAMIEQSLPFGGGFGDVGIVDNAYMEVMLICGVVGLYFLLYFFVRFTKYGYRRKNIPEGNLLYITVLYSSLASLGAPTITKNRFSVLFFVLFTLIMLILHKTNLIKQEA